MWKCPDCHEEIEAVDFSASTRGYETGYASLSEEYEEGGHDRIIDHEYSDGGTDETFDYDYTCPECEAALALSSLEWSEPGDIEPKVYIHQKCYKCFKDQKECTDFVSECKHCKNKPKEPEMEEETHKIITPKHNIMAEINRYKTNPENGMICENKKCKYVFVYEPVLSPDKDEFFECPKCETTNSKLKYLKTLERKK